MKIRNNDASVNTLRRFGANQTALSKDLEKLSSGYKINRAGDDAAGLAVSESMRERIKGLDQGHNNIGDGKSMIRTADGAMVGLIFQLLDYRNGLYGNLYMMITGTNAPNILANGTLFKHIYVWSGVWQATGYSAIIYIASLANVDQSLHEAAMIDGASRFQRMRYIDVPSILPTASIMLILAIGNIMNVGYEKVLLMQNDLNLDYSEIISTYVYKVGLASGITDFSLSTSIGMFNAVINFTLLIIANWISKKLSGSGIF